MGSGGVRPGAGRKSEGSGPKKKISVSISPEAAEALKNLKKALSAKNLSQTVESLILAAWENYQKP